MLLDPASWSPANVIDKLPPTLSPELTSSVATETHAGTLELATGVHGTVARGILKALSSTFCDWRAVVADDCTAVAG
jgi:hypothetical protein